MKKPQLDQKTTLPPSDALQFIETALENGILPELEWVEIAMSPSRLKGRKLVLIRILKDCFGLVGKQRLPIDPEGNDDGNGPNFISLRSVDELGRSCAVLLSQKGRKSGDHETY